MGEEEEAEFFANADDSSQSQSLSQPLPSVSVSVRASEMRHEKDVAIEVGDGIPFGLPPAVLLWSGVGQSPW